ncbi:MAG: ImmA/IrrE family metallo-endopeptidase [Thermomicrobium sp.]
MDLNQEELGRRLGVTRQTVAAWEKGQREPSVTQWTQIAQHLEVPVDLLLRRDTGAQRTHHLLFRSDRAGVLTETEEERLTRRAQDYAAIERIVGELPLLPESRPMDGYIDDAVERVAEETRDWLGVEDAPLGDVLALIEARGLKVIRDQLPEGVWGFSAYTEDLGGVIFVNTRQNGDPVPTERQYFTALHELGHLIFHRREYLEGFTSVEKKDPRERTADHFAGAVLLPARAMRAELRLYKGRWLPEPLLLHLKQRYGVSVITILIRAAQLGYISERQKGQQIGALKKSNPPFGEPTVGALPPPQDLSRMKYMVLGALVAEMISASRAAELLGKPLHQVREDLQAWAPEDDDAA